MKFNIFNLIIDEINQWITSFISFVPGRIGKFSRRLWYQWKFEGASGVGIESGCDFISINNIKIGRNVGIGKYSFFAADGGGCIVVGNNTRFNRNVHINASVGGRIEIGDNVLVGPGVLMRATNHSFSRRDMPIRLQGHVPGEISIEEDVWIGGAVTILAGAAIGKGAIVAAGAVVKGVVPAYAIVGGVPAVLLGWREIFPAELASHSEELKSSK